MKHKNLLFYNCNKNNYDQTLYFVDDYTSGSIIPMVQAKVESSIVSIICTSAGSVTWRFREFNKAFTNLLGHGVVASRETIVIMNAKVRHTGVYKCEGFHSNGTRFFVESTLYVARMLANSIVFERTSMWNI